MEERTGRGARWPDGVRAAVSLTYDGADFSHHQLVWPSLRARRIRATFFMDPAALIQDPRPWFKMSSEGAEIGNGCLLAAAGFDGSLPLWTPVMVADEIETTEQLLDELNIGERPRPFAFPPGQPVCADRQDYREVIAAEGRVARGGLDGWNHPGSCDFSFLRMVRAEGFDARDLIEIVSRAARNEGWVILAFGPVANSGEGTKPDDHERLLAFLAEAGDLWVDTLGAVGKRLQQQTRPHLWLS